MDSGKVKSCPECLAPLVHQKYKIFHTWTCPEGHGTLYPSGELERIANALSGLGDLEVAIWNDRDRWSVSPTTLLSPESNAPMLEIRDRDHMNIIVYGDPVTHSLWFHAGEEEKLVEHLEKEANADSVSSYLLVAAKESSKIFGEEPDEEAAGHTLTALKLLAERIARGIPFITL